MNPNKIVNHPSKVRVQHSPIHGYGVFAIEDIPAGMVIEECVVATETISAVYEYYGKSTINRNSDLMLRYRFQGPMTRHGNVDFYVIPAGFAMVYNHSNDNNVIWHHDVENRLMVFKALKPIKKGEECCTNYGYNPETVNPLTVEEELTAIDSDINVKKGE
jgi:SET domain-containing protein|tara:strand:- start:616 stop:1098 length:483 start_codon:yes stop_codon:yes gene_type:complete